MDKRVIFAVAGSGKTTHIVNSLSFEKRSLVITYSESNYNHLRRKIIEKFGYLPENITVQTYFTFLYSFCYKPFLHYAWRSKGINWDVPPAFTLRLRRTDRRFFIDGHSRLYSNRIAKLALDNVIDDVRARLEKYYDEFLLDEVQDFAGHDFNLLKEICRSDMDILLVGDFYQHTFDTSRDGPTNKNLFHDFTRYQKHFSDIDITVDKDTLSRSYRCSSSVCAFVMQSLGVNIESHKKEETGVYYLDGEKIFKKVFYDDNVVKLFFKEHSKYPCYSNNWGKSKGLDQYDDVCVVLYPKAFKAYTSGNFSKLPASSRNKLYVACTRANRSLYFMNEADIKDLKTR